MKVNLNPIRSLAPPGGGLRKKITLKSALLESITPRTVLEDDFLSILIFVPIFISYGPILKIEVVMTLKDLDWDFKTINYHIIKKLNVL